MARNEFTKATKRKIAARSGGVCERHLWRPGEVCTRPAAEFDHLVPDGLQGAPTVENGFHACKICHVEKTVTEDTPIMRKADAQRDAAAGVKRKSRPIPQPPKLAKPPKDSLPPLPRRSLYA